jgi:hypothetical protein
VRADPGLHRLASMLDDLSLLTSLHRQVVVVESGRADLLEITDELEARCRADGCWSAVGQAWGRLDFGRVATTRS